MTRIIPFNKECRERFACDINSWARFNSRHPESYGSIRQDEMRLILSLLGVAFNRELYGSREGFRKFCNLMGFDYKVLTSYQKSYKKGGKA